MYFGASRESQKKLVQRWAKKLEAKAGQEKDPAAAVIWHTWVKRLDCISSCVNMQFRWIKRTCNDKGAAQFISDFKELATFLDAPPKVPLECPYLWAIFMDALALV